MLGNKTSTKSNDRALSIMSAFLVCLCLVCFIINYSIDSSITWSLFPAGGLVVVWATAAPLIIMKKYKALGLFAGLSITLVLYLFLIQQMVAVKGWFIPLALPVAILSLLAFGVSLLMYGYFKINKYYAAAITIFLFGVIVNAGIDLIVENFLNKNDVNNLSRISTISASVIVALILVVIGYIRKK
ncbi:MAG: DUF6320 domain-containing protein [Ginsengibacter sp.]